MTKGLGLGIGGAKEENGGGVLDCEGAVLDEGSALVAIEGGATLSSDRGEGDLETSSP